jgi:KDO2-lipid IV(A) lauroyltransferase
MPKQRSDVLDYLVYLAVRLVVCFLQMLPYTRAHLFGKGLARLAYRVDRRHRLVAFENLRLAFPEHHRDGVPGRDLLAVYEHFCTLLIEIMHLPRCLHVANWRNFFDMADGRTVVGTLLSGRPLLLITGHFGNWEMGGFILGLLGFRTHAIARTLDNRFLDAYLRRFREATGQGLLAKKGDFDQIEGLLKQNGVLATLADQDAGQRGLFVDFFGRPASTHKAVALLALEHQVPMLVIGVRKVGEPIRYRLESAGVICPEDYKGRSDAVKAITQRFTTELEHLVRRAPLQYFWLHRRWKHQPSARARRVA